MGAKIVDGMVRVFVKDHGAGIPPGSQDKVFGRFSQLDSSDQRRTGGTGLGMNISREIVEAMGGTIDYESELGKGTTFFVDLPWEAEHSTPEAERQDDFVITMPRAVNG